MNTAKMRDLVGASLDEAIDPADKAANMIRYGVVLRRTLQKGADRVGKAMQTAEMRQKGLLKVGAGTSEAQELLKDVKKELGRLQASVNQAMDQMKQAKIK